MCCQGLGLGVWDIALWDGGASQGHGAGPAGCRWQHAVLASWPAQFCAPAWQCKLQELTSQLPDQPCPRCLARAATHGAASAGFHGFGGRQRLCCVTAVPAGRGRVDAVWTMNWQACCRAETALTALPWGAGREVRPCRLSEATQTPLLCPADGSHVITSPGLVLGLVSGQSGPCRGLLHLQLR